MHLGVLCIGSKLYKPDVNNAVYIFLLWIFFLSCTCTTSTLVQTSKSLAMDEQATSQFPAHLQEELLEVV